MPPHQLVAEVLVPAHVEDRHSEGPLAAGLGVRLHDGGVGNIQDWNIAMGRHSVSDLLDVAEPGHELLAGDALAVLVLVPLPDQSGQ